MDTVLTGKMPFIVPQELVSLTHYHQSIPGIIRPSVRPPIHTLINKSSIITDQSLLYSASLCLEQARSLRSRRM